MVCERYAAIVAIIAVMNGLISLLFVHRASRHATYTNQYRATAAMNCRVKKDEILTYTSEGSRVPASLPFHKRQNLVSDNKAGWSTSGQQIARLLQDDEFYPVACSDCGTMVGVFDKEQQYHFFNALPSNC
ncbi:unnamed protein product [Phytophthora lilii]|uniref:Unnamed protein product n=1 Tax=Phytophthora lilii TaxID=2077276 RepID=A0A9W6U6E9_9STRA|nr:unnamed protein product [Phytophthora lilii]